MTKVVKTLFLLSLGVLAGVLSFYFSQPEIEIKTDDKEVVESEPQEEKEANVEFVRLSNQFIVPLIKEGKTTALVILSLTLKVDIGTREEVFAKEPLIRDSLLSTLFNHANSGAFYGTFTAPSRLTSLRQALLATSKRHLEEKIHSVLITDLVRQEVN